ncbi:MAG: hypothetical protein JWO98_5356 [Frankiales bacterium]|nr:hypothetical protein [Frankiales bacterium]
MFAKLTPCNVALIDSLGVERMQLRDRLEQTGCAPVLFSDASEFLAMLSRGRRFDLLLVAESGNSAWSQLSAVCGVIGMPALLLAGEPDGGRATAWLQDFPASPLFDFASLDSHNDELHRRMSRLLHRAREHRDHFAGLDETVFGEYAFHKGMHSVVHKSRDICLQPRQFELALTLFRNVGRVLERQQLWTSLWGAPQGGRSLDVCVANVRRKLHLCPENGFTLNSVYRRGYQLQAVLPMKSTFPEPISATRMHAESAATFRRAPIG